MQWAIDSVGYALFRPFGARKKTPPAVKNILVSRIDHLGDVFLASSILPYMRKKYPGARIDFLAGEWAHGYLRTNSHIDRVLVYNSARLNRAQSFFKSLFFSVTGFIANVREMRSTRYDLAIDLRAYPFNSIPLLFFGGARYRVGFATGGFGFLLDKTVPYRSGVHELAHLRDVLGAIGINVDETELRPEFTPTKAAIKECTRVLEGLGIAQDEKFVLIHTGSGSPSKLWRKDAWQDVVKGIVRRYGIKVVMYDTLYGDSITGCIKLPPLISFEMFAVVAKRASLLVGLDSLPAHLAASFGTPVVAVWCGINDHRQWSPVGSNVAIVRKDVDCSPCYRKSGCANMRCMDISADECIREITKFLDPMKPPRSYMYLVRS